MTVKTMQGTLEGSGLRVAIVVSRFNEAVTEKLLAGALSTLRQGGVEDILVTWVPGALEIPLMAKKLLTSQGVDAVLCLGAVIRGETSHYDVVVNQSAQGISHLGLEFEKPVLNGVLTTDTVEQAMNRAGLKYGNKGSDVARAAIEMATLFRAMLVETQRSLQNS